MTLHNSDPNYDRNPNLDIDDLSSENFKNISEMLDVMSTMRRKDKRKFKKPSFSKSVKDRFKKKILKEE